MSEPGQAKGGLGWATAGARPAKEALQRATQGVRTAKVDLVRVSWLSKLWERPGIVATRRTSDHGGGQKYLSDQSYD